MRNIVHPELEATRMVVGPKRSTRMDGPNGAFTVTIKGDRLRVIAHDGVHGHATGWEHVSVSLSNKSPSWEQMEVIRRLFWAETETVVQIHPPLDDYVNIHPYTLHLWRKIGGEHELPPKELI